MKKLLTVLMLSVPAFVFAQTDTTKHTIHEQYCVLNAVGKSFSNKVNMNVDFGQATKLLGSNYDEKLKDPAGRLLTFNSAVDALNYMSSRGWTLVNAYPVAEGVINYIMRRPVN